MMRIETLTDLFATSRRRHLLVGTPTGGVVIGLDLEGRLFAVLNGKILNRVNEEAFRGICTRDAYLNPGGDGLWPAPEGSELGYEYATGDWRVPPGLTNARFQVLDTTPAEALVRAEVDLINSRGLGIPIALERRVAVESRSSSLRVTTTETVEYLGSRELTADEALLAPWTLCQFDSGPGCTALYPDAGPDAAWDLYEDSSELRIPRDGIWHCRTDGAKRYQIGLSPAISWLEYRNPSRGLKVRRTAEPLPETLRYIDIADRAPHEAPAGPPVRFSIYSDPSCFMEIEAAGGSPTRLVPGLRSSLMVHTHYILEQ